MKNPYDEMIIRIYDHVHLLFYTQIKSNATQPGTESYSWS